MANLRTRDKKHVVKIIVASPSKYIIKGIDAVLSNKSAFSLGKFVQSLTEVEKLSSADGDVLLMDASIHGSQDRRAVVIRKLSKQKPDLKIIIFNGVHYAPNRVKAMLEAGASGFISKYADDQFDEAITTVLNDKKYLCAMATQQLADYFIKRISGDGEVHLTKREKVVVRLLALEFTNQEIADKLDVSRRTVETFRKNIFKKLGVRSLAGVAIYAARQGLVDIIN